MDKGSIRLELKHINETLREITKQRVALNNEVRYLKNRKNHLKAQLLEIKMDPSRE